MIQVKAEFFLNSVKLDSAVDFYVGERLGLLFARRKLLEKKGVKLQRVNEARFGVEIDTSDDNGTSVKNDTKFVFWSSNMGSGLVQSRLKRLGLWIIDAESLCTAKQPLEKDDISGPTKHFADMVRKDAENKAKDEEMWRQTYEEEKHWEDYASEFKDWDFKEEEEK
ncbi:hypothetical protein Tco_0594686 [Tanacetum coccineum]